jgi:hypothetical protein
MSDATQSASRHRSELGNAACSRLRSELRAADEVARREGVSRAGRVHDFRLERFERLAVDDEAIGAALENERAGRLPADRRELAFVREHESGLQQPQAAEQALRSVGRDAGRRGEIDADAAALRLNSARCLRGGFLDGLAQQRVAGEMEPLAASEPAHIEILRAQAGSDSAVGEHRPGSVRRDERDDDAICAVLDRPVQLDAAACELAGGQLAGAVGPALADEMRFGPERGSPGGDVRGLPSRADSRLGAPLLLGLTGAVGPDDHVEQ